MINQKTFIIRSILLCFYLLSAAVQAELVNTNSCCTVLFSHGIADTYKQAFWYAKSYEYNGITYTNDRYLFPCPFATFNYPDATQGPLRVNYKETSFGQENEIQRLNYAYKQTKQWAYDKWNNCNIILFGLSRGASNLGIFAGTHILEHVKAIVLESPYYTMSEVIAHMLKKINLGWIPVYYGETVAEFIFKRYNRLGMSPATTVENISHDIPVLIVCSKEDDTVPCKSSINVYKKLLQSGHPNTYILILDHGKHAKILSDRDGQKYQSVVHAFYKKYNLPYDPAIAASEEFLLSKCQPKINKKI